MLNVAKYWGVSPQEVEDWAMPDFLDREEYMEVLTEIENPAPPEKWEGPKRG